MGKRGAPRRHNTTEATATQAPQPAALQAAGAARRLPKSEAEGRGVARDAGGLLNAQLSAGGEEGRRHRPQSSRGMGRGCPGTGAAGYRRRRKARIRQGPERANAASACVSRDHKDLCMTSRSVRINRQVRERTRSPMQMALGGRGQRAQ